jgi:hypothetical protein
MREAWEALTAGPEDADRSVLLLPGGANAARSFNPLMAEPALSGVRFLATTLPGMAGAPLSDDVSVPALAGRAGELPRNTGATWSWASLTAPRLPWRRSCPVTSKALSCSSASA